MLINVDNSQNSMSKKDWHVVSIRFCPVDGDNEPLMLVLLMCISSPAHVKKVNSKSKLIVTAENSGDSYVCR